MIDTENADPKAKLQYNCPKCFCTAAAAAIALASSPAHGKPSASGVLWGIDLAGTRMMTI